MPWAGLWHSLSKRKDDSNWSRKSFLRTEVIQVGLETSGRVVHKKRLTTSCKGSWRGALSGQRPFLPSTYFNRSQQCARPWPWRGYARDLSLPPGSREGERGRRRRKGRERERDGEQRVERGVGEREREREVTQAAVMQGDHHVGDQHRGLGEHPGGSLILERGRVSGKPSQRCTPQDQILNCLGGAFWERP